MHDFLTDVKPLKPLLDAIDTRLVTRALNRKVVATIDVAFDHGGYVAGGFARFMAGHLHPDMPPVDEDKLCDGLVRNFMLHQHVSEELIKKQPYWRCQASDIDIWFPDEQHLNDFFADERTMKQLGSSGVIETSSPEGAAREFVVHDARVQVITAYLGERHDRLSTFDIYNSMVAFNRDTLTVPQGWLDLESRKMLHVVNWDSPWTLRRVFKYLDRKGYTSVTPPTAKSLTEHMALAMKCMAETKDPVEWRRSAMYKRTGARSPRALFSRFKGAFPSFTNEQLLFLASLRPLDRYNHAFNLLRERGGVDAPVIPET